MLLWKIFIITLYPFWLSMFPAFFAFLCRILEALLVGFITTSIAFFGPIYLASCKTLPAVSLFLKHLPGRTQEVTIKHSVAWQWTWNRNNYIKSPRYGQVVGSFTNNAAMLHHLSEAGWSEPVSSIRNILSIIMIVYSSTNDLLTRSSKTNYVRMTGELTIWLTIEDCLTVIQ